jgi:hypothetical protein
MDPVDLMIANASEDIFQIGRWIHAVHFGSANQTVLSGGLFATCIRTGKQVVFSANGDMPD